MTTDDRTAIDLIRQRLAALDSERLSLEAELARFTSQTAPALSTSRDTPVTASSDNASKVRLFQRLFAGREDVFPVRWENSRTGRTGYAPACANEWVRGVCDKPRIKCGECLNRAFIPVSESVVQSHLRGELPGSSQGQDYVIGVYPLLADETCRFLAVDFDGDSWADDARAYLETCQHRNVTAALERSRSGNGGHIWIFFTDAVPAREARQLGALLLTETMERRPEISFHSYDRFFPSQDTMPQGGFGNLIALPLQRRARERGHSVFVDGDLQPYPDQWAFLSSISPMSPTQMRRLIAEAEAAGRILGVRMPVDDEQSEDPWRLPPSRRTANPVIPGLLPRRVSIVLAGEVYVDRSALPPALVARLVRTAAFQNPEFDRAQALRLSTFGKRRVISCAVLHPRHIALPRGCVDEMLDLLRSHNVEPDIEDQRESGSPLSLTFSGTLRPEQAAACAALTRHDTGVLAAGTAFGKTVVAAAVIAQRQTNTLVLVHRRELVTQWVERLRTFLDLSKQDIGVIGGGRRKPTGKIDVALIQSLVRKGEVSDLVSGYGQLIVDECHHLSAVSFELVARRCRARYVLGLSATVARKDGHHPIIFMQCGPTRFRVDAKTQATRRGFAHRVHLRSTGFRLPASVSDDRLAMPAIYGALSRDTARNDLIFDDVLKSLDAGRSPLVLTERREHLDLLAARFENFTRNLVVLRGGMGVRDRRKAEDRLQVPADEERLVLATGRYLGEGFDDPRLDTLFLTMPISWRGTLAQYVGRLHREHNGKSEVIVYDYVDQSAAVLARMAMRRQIGYRAMGYVIGGDDVLATA